MPRKAAQGGLPWGHGWAGPGGMGGRGLAAWVGGAWGSGRAWLPGSDGWARGQPGAPPVAPTPSPTGAPGAARGATHSPTPSPTGELHQLSHDTPTTRRKTAPNAAKPPNHPARGHDKNRTARPRCLGAAATTASPAESSRAQPWLRPASRGPSLRCPDAPGHGPATRLVERVPPLGDNTSG